MYSLDINFLKDRVLERTADIGGLPEPKKVSVADYIPIAAGVVVALVLPAVVFGYLKTVQAQTASIEQETKQMESEIADLGNQNQKIEEVNQQIQRIEQQTQALVGVFEKIRPWAAILQEISDRTPPGVQVNSIQQSGSGENVGVNLAGVARTYDDVNDFVLFLQKSPFFDGKKIKLNGASLANFAVDIENQEELSENLLLSLPQGVKYTVSAQLNNLPTSKLIQEIDSKGSVGLVTRLKTLERKGVEIK